MRFSIKCIVKYANIGFFLRCVFIIFVVLVYRYDLLSTYLERIVKKPGIIYMLQWTSRYTQPFVFMGKGTKTFEKRKCRMANCYVTDNKYILGDVNYFDVLLFHEKEFIEAGKFGEPFNRNLRQKYVFASTESSGNYPVPTQVYDEYFNITWTYKLTSDVNFGYITVRNKNGEIIGPQKEMHWISRKDMLPTNVSIINKLKNKHLAAAWFVSNCDSANKRQIVAAQIASEMAINGMVLDIYGGCGYNLCPRSYKDRCLRMIQEEYYFYFAFENSNAEDYVTEKLLTALNNFAVPIVFGGANYTRFMPDGIYLDVVKLGVKGLVNKMHTLMQDKNKYIDYFKWHNHYSYHSKEDSADTDPYCKLCEYLNEMKDRTQVFTDLSQWWNPSSPQQQLAHYLNTT